MADVQTQLELAPLGTREKSIKIVATIAVTDGADTKHSVAVVFDKAFVRAPSVIGAVTIDDASNAGVASVDSLTATGCNVNLYQSIAGSLGTGDHDVVVNIVGWTV